MNAREKFGSKQPSILERKYVAQVLTEEANNIWKKQGQAIDEYGLHKTGLMKNSRRWKLAGKESFYNEHLEIYFVKYLRFNDMNPKNRNQATILGVEAATKKRRRQYHIYNRIVFGHLNNIVFKLAYGFTEEVKTQLAAKYNIELEG